MLEDIKLQEREFVSGMLINSFYLHFRNIEIKAVILFREWCFSLNFVIINSFYKLRNPLYPIFISGVSFLYYLSDRHEKTNHFRSVYWTSRDEILTVKLLVSN